MSRQMRVEPRLASAGTKQSVKDSELESVSLREDNEITVFSEQVPADKLFAWGYGSDDRNQGRTSYIYADVQDNNGNDVEGDIMYVVTDSEQRDVLARYDLGDIQSLRDAASEARTDRPTNPVLGPAASEDRHIELRIEADAASDGATIDPSASDVRFFYSDINR